MTELLILTPKQKEEMLHALGLSKGGKKVYRNNFCTYGEDESWEDLVKRGLATKHPFRKGFLPENGIDYCVSDEGAKALGLDPKVLHANW